MASSMQGLRLKPTYEQLIGVAVSDELRNIKFPNRDAKFLRDGFVLSQLDGEGQRQMEKQQEMASKEAYKEQLLKQIAKNTGSDLHDLRNDNHQDLRIERVNNVIHFDISQGDDDMGDDMESLYSLPTSDAGPERPSQGSQGIQTDRPSTRVGMAQATTSMNEMDTQTPHVKKKDKDTQSSPIVEDRSEELERLKDEHEARIRETERYNQIKLSNIINQVRGETRHHTIGEAEEMHRQRMTEKVSEIEFRNAQKIREMELKYEQQMREIAQDNNLTKRQAKQIIQETEAQAIKEARHFTGRLFSYAEEQHAQKIASERKEKEEANQRPQKNRKQRTQY